MLGVYVPLMASLLNENMKQFGYWQNKAKETVLEWLKDFYNKKKRKNKAISQYKNDNENEFDVVLDKLTEQYNNDQNALATDIWSTLFAGLNFTYFLSLFLFPFNPFICFLFLFSYLFFLSKCKEIVSKLTTSLSSPDDLIVHCVFVLFIYFILFYFFFFAFFYVFVCIAYDTTADTMHLINPWAAKHMDIQDRIVNDMFNNAQNLQKNGELILSCVEGWCFV